MSSTLSTTVKSCFATQSSGYPHLFYVELENIEKNGGRCWMDRSLKNRFYPRKIRKKQTVVPQCGTRSHKRTQGSWQTDSTQLFARHPCSELCFLSTLLAGDLFLLNICAGLPTFTGRHIGVCTFTIFLKWSSEKDFRCLISITRVLYDLMICYGHILG